MEFQKASGFVLFLSVALFQALYCQLSRSSVKESIDTVTLTLSGATILGTTRPFIHSGTLLNTRDVISVERREVANASMRALPGVAVISGVTGFQGFVGQSIDVGPRKNRIAMATLAGAGSDFLHLAYRKVIQQGLQFGHSAVF